MSEIDLFVSSTGKFNISTLDHMKKLKNNAFVGSTRHFYNEIGWAGSEGLEGMKIDDLPESFLLTWPERFCRR